MVNAPVLASAQRSTPSPFLHVKPWAANPAQEKLLASEEKVVELQQQLQRMRLEQETLAQRNALLERLLAMQQQAQQQTPTETGKRAAIEGQKDAWWLDKQMKVGLDNTRLPVLHRGSIFSRQQLAAGT